MNKSLQVLCAICLLILPLINHAQIWVARYNGPANDDDWAFAIAVDDAGNVYVTGRSASYWDNDYVTIKYNASGVEQWVARYNGSGYDNDHAWAIALDSAGNVYVTGTSYGSGTSNDYATVKYDTSGVEQWVARYNSPGNYGDFACAIALDDADNVYVTGTSYGPDTNYDYATVKYDTSGVEQWVARYNGPGNYDDFACAIALDSAGNVYVTGTSYSSGTSNDYATVKYDTSGVEQWVARYNGPGNEEDCAIAIAVDYMGNVHVTGHSMGLGTGIDYATVKYNTSGVEQWVKRYNGPGNHNDLVKAIALDDASYVYVTGGSRDVEGTDLDYTTIKYSYTGINEDVATHVRVINYGTSIISGSLLLPSDKKCKVFDITGRFVEPTKINRGIYFIEIDGKVTQKVVKVR